MQTLTWSLRDVATVQKLLRRRSPKLKLTRFWRLVSNEYGLGVTSADERYICFSAAERQQLRNVVLQNVNLDPLTDELPDFSEASRVVIASYSSHEKQGGRAVGAGRVLATSAAGFLTVDGERYPLSQAAGLLVDWRRLREQPAMPVVLIENGAAFNDWHIFRLPENLRTAVAVYRGHDVSATAVNEWFHNLPKDKRIGCYDFDPAGLAIAKQRDVGFLLVPSNPDLFLRKAGPNRCAPDKPAAFLEQHHQHESNRNWISGEARDAWCWMDKHGTSITQEAMANSAAPMRLIPI